MFRLTKEGQLLYKYSKEMMNRTGDAQQPDAVSAKRGFGNIRVSTIYSDRAAHAAAVPEVVSEESSQR